MYINISYENSGGVATITLNRPQAGNAFAKEMYGEVADAFEAASADPEVRVVVVTGAGRHFSAGGDINRFKMLIETGEYLQAENVAAAGKMAATAKLCKKPVIAMVNGAAAGAGCSLALACDFRIVTPKSKLVMSFVKMGLSGDTGGLYYLQKLVGTGKACELMMTGKQVSGEEAVQTGLATKLVEDGCLHEETYRFAKELAEMPTFAIGMQKQLLVETFYSDIAPYTERESNYMVACSHTDDFAEAVDAFLEKRPPAFTGK